MSSPPEKEKKQKLSEFQILTSSERGTELLWDRIDAVIDHLENVATFRLRKATWIEDLSVIPRLHISEPPDDADDEIQTNSQDASGKIWLQSSAEELDCALDATQPTVSEQESLNQLSIANIAQAEQVAVRITKNVESWIALVHARGLRTLSPAILLDVLNDELLAVRAFTDLLRVVQYRMHGRLDVLEYPNASFARHLRADELREVLTGLAERSIPEYAEDDDDYSDDEDFEMVDGHLGVDDDLHVKIRSSLSVNVVNEEIQRVDSWTVLSNTTATGKE